MWLAFMAVWTVMLEMPVPATGHLPGGAYIVTYRPVLAKTLHVMMYTAMTLLAAWLRLPARWRPLMMFALMAHATATELLQALLADYCHRTGTLNDVGLDHLGIALGLLLTWKKWTAASE
jgi:hypothetical protein